MKLTSPLTILRDALKKKHPETTTCFIDDNEVSMKECDIGLEEKPGIPNVDFWDR